jgi:alkylation response protein AidB-like acyl-CoA dehydrogenase
LFPEQYDGLSEHTNPIECIRAGAFDILWIMELLGKHLCLEPYLFSVVMAGVSLLLHASESQRRSFLPKIAAGELKLALAFQEPLSRYSISHVSTRAEPLDPVDQRKRWVINGAKCVVHHANAADHVIVSVRTSAAVGERAGISLFIVPLGTPGVTLTHYKTHDSGVASDLVLDQVHVSEDQLLGQPGEGWEILNDMIERANAALCAQAVGIMGKMCDLTLEYLKTRRQFGVPIGKFQALQHRMADMVISTEQARSMSIFAANAMGELDPCKRSRDISAAKAYICRVARQVGQESIQLHGGMGVTNEMSIGHYFKKLTLITQTFGDLNEHVAVVSDYLLTQD